MYTVHSRAAFLVALMIAPLFIHTAFSQNAKPVRKSEDSAEKIEALKKNVKHIIVIYEENWSFDGLFGDFPGANNLTRARKTSQYDVNGKLLTTAPQPFVSTYTKPATLDHRFDGITLPAGPYDLLKYIRTPDTKTGDLRHLFYSEQLQIDSGKMDKFIAYSDNP